MESLEDDSALNIDSLMEYDDDIETDNEYNIEPIPLYFLSNTLIEFGFFEQSTNSFKTLKSKKETSNPNLSLKNGSGIHIKKKNRGSFTKIFLPFD